MQVCSTLGGFHAMSKKFLLVFSTLNCKTSAVSASFSLHIRSVVNCVCVCVCVCGSVDFTGIPTHGQSHGKHGHRKWGTGNSHVYSQKRVDIAAVGGCAKRSGGGIEVRVCQPEDSFHHAGCRRSSGCFMKSVMCAQRRASAARAYRDVLQERACRPRRVE